MPVGTERTPESLLIEVYPELRQMAARLLRRERTNHTLQRTALVHEAFLRLFGQQPDANLSAEAFLALAGRQMRHILIDYGRKRRTDKRGGELIRASVLEIDLAVSTEPEAFLALDEALRKLERLDPRAHSVVELKFFCGFTTDETARILGVSDGTVEADWLFARSWLFGILAHNNASSRV